jgi:aryl-alcohol dehydrogenase-like predicted oxidoreductase
MEKRICKNSGFELSVLGLGCWTFGGESDDYWGSQDQKDVDGVIRAALDAGINYFDTAELYNAGRSEISLGRAIKGISRDQLVIGSKVSPSNCYPDTLVKHCEDSLRRLDTDYLDLYMVHWPIHSFSMKFFTSDQAVIENPPQTAEAFQTLQKLKDQGKIRHIGVSNYGKNKLAEIPEDIVVTADQLPYSLLSRAIEFEAMEVCSSNGTGIIAYMSLMQGILTGKYASVDEIPHLRMRTRHFNSSRSPQSRHGEPGFESETLTALEDISRISNEAGIPMHTLALKWVISNPAITCTLVGARNEQQVLDNVRQLDSELPADVASELEKVTRDLKDKMGNHIDLFESAENDRTN